MSTKGVVRGARYASIPARVRASYRCERYRCELYVTDDKLRIGTRIVLAPQKKV